MQSDAPLPASADPGLPTVQPPSGKMIFRLFLVPGLIVAGLVGLFLLGPTLANWAGKIVGRPWGQSRSADQFLRDLDSANLDIRYRAASDLAQVLVRDDRLASDVGFGLALADRLEQARANSADAEKSFAQRHDGLSEGDKARELKKLEADRTYVTYLTACMGHFLVPVGVEQLKAMALQEEGMEMEELLRRRRRALLALAILGESVKRFDEKLSDEQRDEVMAQLQSAIDSGTQRKLASLVRNHLSLRRKGQPDTMGIGAVLVRCAEAEDPSLRFQAAFAMTFWVGRGADEEAMVKALVKLAHDNGRGEEKLHERQENNPDAKISRSLTKRRGFHVRPQAAVALARRGSPHAPLDLLAEMLDDEGLRQVYVLQNKKTGEEVPDENLVALTVTEALKALARLREKRPEDTRLGERFGPALDRLAQHRNATIRTEAEKAKLAFGR